MREPYERNSRRDVGLLTVGVRWCLLRQTSRIAPKFMPPLVLLIDDHPAFRVGLGLIIKELAGGVALGEASSFGRALAMLEAQPHPDLVVYDWYLPDGGGLHGLLALMQLLPGVPVVVMSSTVEEAVRLTALQVGAKEYLSKSAEAREIRDVLRATLTDSGPRATRQPTGAVPLAKLPRLTARQLEVLRLMSDGLQNKEIAAALHIAEPTARDHVSDVLSLLRAKNRTEAVAVANRQGLIRLWPAPR